MATVDPSRSGDHRPDGPPVAYPDPFPAYPNGPYQSGRQPAAEYDDPPTDPTFPALSSYDDFDPFSLDAFQRPAPWYRKPSAMMALAAIVLAVAAVLVAAFLLLSGRWTVGTGSTTDVSPPANSGTVTSEPATTPLTSPPPPPPPESPPEPPPPPPGEQNPAPAQPRHTYVPNYPRQPQDNRRHVTTPETRPPDISVRPTHRPAFPGQPGEN